MAPSERLEVGGSGHSARYAAVKRHPVVVFWPVEALVELAEADGARGVFDCVAVPEDNQAGVSFSITFITKNSPVSGAIDAMIIDTTKVR
jgi:hypothetical protein